jgi:hypothetical protein
MPRASRSDDMDRSNHFLMRICRHFFYQVRGFFLTADNQAWDNFERMIGLLKKDLKTDDVSLRFDGQPLRKPPRAENLQPVGHAPPRGHLNPWQTNTSFPRDLAGAGATPRVILDVKPRRRSQMKPSGLQSTSWPPTLENMGRSRRKGDASMSPGRSITTPSP